MEPKLPAIPDAERTPLIAELLAIIESERKRIQKLEGEKEKLEGEKEKLEGEKEKLEGEKEKLEGEKKRLESELERFRKRLAQYEPEVWYEGKRTSTDDEALSGSFSMDAEDKRRRGRRRRKKSPGRRPTEVKFADAKRFESVYPEGVNPTNCRLVRERAIWRLEDGKAILVGYRIYAGPDGKEARIPGVTARCEYGVEILVVLSFLKYIIGISLDKTCAVLGFFCGLSLSKSQADALLRQLANHWEAEYDTLCELIAHAAVVYMDETGWKVGNENCSLWLFASQLHAVFLFGCNKDDATLDEMLPPDVFGGIGVSDDAAVYRERFAQGQKCWAHLLRKLIRLALLYPRKKTYQRLLDDLLKLYREAKQAAADGRLSEEGRERRISEFEGRICDLCEPYWQQEMTAAMKPHERDFAKFVNELMRLCLAEELFTFVRVPEVEPTNNQSERKLRNPAMDRKAGRTNQTAAGAHRRSVIVSVLESLRSNLKQFTLTAVLEEVTRWMRAGLSLFAEQWQKIQPKQPIPQPNTG
jgi:transposase